MRVTPIEKMIDVAVRCYKCEKCSGDCECYDDDPKVVESLTSRRWHQELDDAFEEEAKR